MYTTDGNSALAFSASCPPRTNARPPDSLGVELLGAPPLADAVEAEDVVALLEDAEASLRGGLLVQHYVHADAARLARAALHRKRQLHVLLMLQHALLREKTQTRRCATLPVRAWKQQGPAQIIGN